MHILHLLNIADYFFMATGVAVALVMIAMGGSDERRQTDRTAPQAPRRKAGAARGRRR